MMNTPSSSSVTPIVIRKISKVQNINKLEDGHADMLFRMDFEMIFLEDIKSARVFNNPFPGMIKAGFENITKIYTHKNTELEIDEEFSDFCKRVMKVCKVDEADGFPWEKSKERS